MNFIDRVRNSAIGTLVIGVALGSLFGGWLVSTYYSWLSGSFETTAGLISSFSAGASIILVLVTAIYAVLTMRLVDETEQTRKQSVRPVLSLDTASIFLGSKTPKLENIGNGPAIDVNANFKTVPGGPNEEITKKSLGVGNVTGVIDLSISDQTTHQYEKLVVEGEFSDIYDESHKFYDEIDFDLYPYGNAAEYDLEKDERLEELEGINDHLQDIADSIEMDGLSDYLTFQYRESILELIRVNGGSITISELQKEAGIDPFELRGTLARLHHYGAIAYCGESEDIYDVEDGDFQIRISE